MRQVEFQYKAKSLYSTELSKTPDVRNGKRCNDIHKLTIIFNGVTRYLHGIFHKGHM